MPTRNVLITGGSAGIGRACVERFAQAGDNVWFTYRLGADRATVLAEKLNAEGPGTVRAFAFDQGDWADHQRLLDELPGPVCVLVNNAAVGSATVARYAGPSQHERDEAMLRINALGPLWLTRKLLPQLIEQGCGKIVNVSSVGGGVSQFPGFRLADGMSKAALGHFTRQLAAELAHEPVEVFAICPGAVETGMFEASTLNALDPVGQAELVHRLPRGRLIDPAEVAELIFWLAGPDSTLLHGAVIDASMGLGVHPGLLTGQAH
ncbi:NAD(P)-dependent dehydrogenase (short-subunit alcohol dehydrogenase family) [Kitasatospora sp. GP30]|uniref:SDR family NAD(P)-dependent oxidoreductase n=1 Tax=Kitasatospora sp. GP30 TaxID=3035084 RepID=UPI000C70537A|nr:SDR family oxidoreductase [Kitasatospora sp. GP30]MDH6142505.1 NAD(P)-dependent dehydrogenase (short-subunit alcohol dehydrogenase family) [Kitasatospora sp. GP30]